MPVLRRQTDLSEFRGSLVITASSVKADYMVRKHNPASSVLPFQTPNIYLTVYIWTHREWDSTQKTCISSSQRNPSDGAGGDTRRVPPLAEELLGFGSCWERESQFSLVWRSLMSRPYSRAGPHLIVAEQHQLELSFFPSFFLSSFKGK